MGFGSARLRRTLAVAACVGSTFGCANPGFAVDGKTAGLRPKLAVILRMIESHFGRKVTVTSGCRSRAHNRAIHGAKESWHLRCQAADIEVASVSKNIVLSYALRLPSIGGVGLYCHDHSIHVDTGMPRRRWIKQCNGKRQFNLR